MFRSALYLLLSAVLFVSACTSDDPGIHNLPGEKPGTVEPPAPLEAVAAEVEVEEDASVSVPLSALAKAGITDVTFTVAAKPAHGAAELGDTEVTYTPAADYNGSDKLVVTLRRALDGAPEEKVNATISITVTPVNDGPVVLALSKAGPEDTTLSGTLSADDADGDTLTFAAAILPAYGTLTLNAATGTFDYVPDANFFGDDSFLVTVSDGVAESPSVEVALTIAPVNDLPVAADATLFATEDTVKTGSLSATDVEGETLAYSLVTQATQGTALITAGGAYTYTPDANAFGVDTFSFRVSDGTGWSNVATASLVIAPVNDTPVSYAQSITTAEDTAFTGTLGAADVETAAPVFTIVSNPASGSVSLGANGAFTYTPAANFNGSDSFTFRVFDGLAFSNTSTVSITVTAVNDAPAATAETKTTAEDTALTATVGVSDVDSGSFTYEVVTAPVNGTFNLNTGTGAYTYTPPANFFGSVYFTFRAHDGQLYSSAASVAVVVTAVNDTPVAFAQAITTDEDTAYNGTVLGSDVETVALTYAVVTPPGRGSVSMGAGGTFTYTPSANLNGADSFTFRAYDGAAYSSPVTVSVSVTAVNDAPVATAETKTTAEDTALTATVGVSDVDSGAFTYEVVTAPVNGTFNLNTGTGAYTYTPPANFFGSVYFTFRAHDGQLYSSAASVAVVVTAVNDVPVAFAQAITTDEDTAYNGTVLGSDVETVALTYAVVTQPGRGSVSMGAGGTFTYTPSANLNGADSFTFRAYDGAAYSSPVTVSVSVTAVNDAPVATAETKTTAEDTALTATVGVSDVDSGSFTYEVVTAPVNGTFNLNTGTGAYTYTPPANFFGSVYFTFRAHDGQLYSSAASVAVVVTAVNDVPVAYANAFTADEDAEVSGSLTAFDQESAALTFDIAVYPANGTVAVTAAGVFTYMPDTDFNGSDAFSFSVWDGAAFSAAAQVQIDLNPVNDAPVAAASAESTPEDTQLSAYVGASDVENDLLTYAVVTAPVAGSLALNALTGAYTYSPVTNATGTVTFWFTAADAEFASAPQPVTITVTPVNDAPVAYGAAATTAEDTDLNGTLIAADVESSPLTYEVTVYPAHGTVAVNASVGTYTYTPALNYTGLDAFSFRAYDGGLYSNTVSIDLAVTPVDDAPLAAGSAESLSEDAAVSGVLAGSDADSAVLTYALVTAPTSGAVTVYATAGTYAYTPDPDYAGGDAFWYNVYDGVSYSAPGKVTLTVNPVNDAPVAADRAESGTEDTALEAYFAATDIDSGALTYAVQDAPASGSVVVLNAATGQYRYTPAANVNGAVTFTYRAHDGALYSNTATVTVTLAAVNDLPVAQAGSIATSIDAPKSGILPGSDADGDTLTFALFASPASGAVVIDDAATGAFTYTPDSGFSGDDAFTFRISDAAGWSNVATIAVTVMGPPVLTAVSPATTAAGLPLSLRGSSFYDAVGSVIIDGAPAQVGFWSRNAIGVTVPAVIAAGPHTVAVVTAGGTSNTLPFSVKPFLHAAARRAYRLGDTISITAGSLGAVAGQAYIGGQPATVSSWTPTLVTLQFPATVSGSGRAITFTTSDGTATNKLAADFIANSPAVNNFWLTDPAPPSSGVSVWTGTEMFLYGPTPGSTMGAGRYNPATDSWSPVSMVNAPSYRAQPGIVWTGTEVIVWGGNLNEFPGQGGRYNPATDSWTPTTNTGASSKRAVHTMVWSGTQVLIYGGESGSGGFYFGGIRYEPASDTWVAMTSPSIAARYHHSAVWTGSRMIVFGGKTWYSNFNDGAIYDPVADAWSALETLGAPSARNGHLAVWTGDEMLLWGGHTCTSTCPANDGYRYKPGVGWSAMSAAGAPSARSSMANVWTGKELLIWGGYAGSTRLGDGAGYDPRVDSWRPLSTVGVPPGRGGMTAVWTGIEMLAYGGYTAAGPQRNGIRYRPQDGRWGTSGVDARPRAYHAAVWSGSEMLVWGGADSTTNYLNTGDRYDPAAHRWTPMTTTGAPAGRQNSSAAWAGDRMIVWGGYGGAYLNTGGEYDPATNSWVSTPIDGNTPSPRSGSVALWSGSRLLIWGPGGAFGSRYDPVGRSWQRIATSGQPSGRSGFGAVWAGDEMIIWGGTFNYTDNFNTGGRYDPVGDYWTPTTTAGAPQGRREFAYVWTGSELLVYGGIMVDPSWNTIYLSDGGHYDPATDTWSAMGVDGAPTYLFRPYFGWSGREMLAWRYSSINGRYDPVTRTWRPITATGAPSLGDNATGVVGGGNLMLFGGYSGNYYNEVGTYVP